jgi:hypothetical protein
MMNILYLFTTIHLSIHGNHIRDIRVNQIFLLNNQGLLISDIHCLTWHSHLVLQHFRLLSNGNETRTLIIPLQALTGTRHMDRR